ncbi:hypothetical protein ACFL45_07200 [Candidatus Neomarinimicrobiota bacterium]
MRTHLRVPGAVLLWLMIISLAAVAPAQEPGNLSCDQCSLENVAANKYCTNCGDPLGEEYARWQLDQQTRQLQVQRFISGRVDPPRLYTVPVARVLGSMDVRVMGGGDFGVATDKSFLGTVSIGLGDIAEVEFSTVGMVTNISRGAAVFPTSAFKLLLIPENRWHIPTLAIAFRNSSNWQDVRSDAKRLAQYADNVKYGISRVGYDTRFTTMYGVATMRGWSMAIHGGISLTDIRVRDLSVFSSDYIGRYTDAEEKQKNVIGAFIGFDVESNPQTKLLFEARTVSSYHYNPETSEIEIREAYLAIGGVRFFFNSWLSTDVGIWYQSTFKGIADMQIKIGLNLYIPSGSIAGKLKHLPNRKSG